jgi:hypothetical protein
MSNVSKLNLELVNFLTLTTNTVGNSFANIKSYTSKTSGEVANHRVNLNFKYTNAQAKDLKTMIENPMDFKAYQSKFEYALQRKIGYLKANNANVKTIAHFENLGTKLNSEIYAIAFEKVYNSVVAIGGKNYDGTTKVQSIASKTQCEMYEHLNGTVKYYDVSDTLYVYAKTESKTVLVNGKLNETKNGIEVFIKDTLTKEFLSTKYRNYIVSRIDVMNALKSSFKGSEIWL